MKIALLSLAMIGSPLIATASDGVPHLNVEATCKGTVAVDKSMDLASPQSYEACMRDETNAQQQLGPIWSTTPATVRSQCYSEAVAGGIESYVDLLSCIQMAADAQSLSSPIAPRGGGKNRDKKQ